MEDDQIRNDQEKQSTTLEDNEHVGAEVGFNKMNG